ncbi:MAG: DUF4190 domain-containing protein, partial [Microbacterium sp.]
PAPAYGAAPAAPAYGAAPAAPAYGAAPAAPGYGGQHAESVPGKTLGIVALIVTFFASAVGLILGYVAASQSKKAGVPNTPAKVAIILGWIFTAFAIVIGIVIIAIAVSVAGQMAAACAEYGPGEWLLENGTFITCD